MSRVPQSSQPWDSCSLCPCAGLRTSLTRPWRPGTAVLSFSAEGADQWTALSRSRLDPALLCQPSLWAAGPLQAEEGVRVRPEAQVEPSCFQNARFNTKATRHPVVQISFFSGGGEVLAWCPTAQWPLTGCQPPAPWGSQWFPGVPKGLCFNENAHSSPRKGRATHCGLQGSAGPWRGCWVLYPGSGLPCWEPQPTRPPKPQEAVEAAESRGHSCPSHPFPPLQLPLPPSSLL